MVRGRLGDIGAEGPGSHGGEAVWENRRLGQRGTLSCPCPPGATSGFGMMKSLFLSMATAHIERYWSKLTKGKAFLREVVPNAKKKKNMVKKGRRRRGVTHFGHRFNHIFLLGYKSFILTRG